MTAPREVTVGDLVCALTNSIYERGEPTTTEVDMREADERVESILNAYIDQRVAILLDPGLIAQRIAARKEA